MLDRLARYTVILFHLLWTGDTSRSERVHHRKWGYRNDPRVKSKQEELHSWDKSLKNR